MELPDTGFEQNMFSHGHSLNGAGSVAGCGLFPSVSVKEGGVRSENPQKKESTGNFGLLPDSMFGSLTLHSPLPVGG